jgi:hypothetical protein
MRLNKYLVTEATKTKNDFKVGDYWQNPEGFEAEIVKIANGRVYTKGPSKNIGIDIKRFDNMLTKYKYKKRKKFKW